MAWKGLKWTGVTRRSLEWPIVARSGAERTKEDLKCARLDQSELEWLKVAQSGSE